MENKKTTANPLINNASAKGPIMTKVQPTAVKVPVSSAKPSAPVAKTDNTAVKTAPTAINKKPTANPTQATPVSSANSKKASKKGGKDNKKGKIVLFGICVAVIIIAIIAIIIVTTRGDGTYPTDEQDGGTPAVAEVTEDEIKKTKETLDKYAEVTVDGYKQEEGHEISEHIVKVHVKNISEEQTSLHIVIVANDKDGNALDVSHLYAEGIRPGETQEFDTFVYTTMTPEQMKAATYKVYTADTYEVNIPEEPAPEETPAE